MAQFPPERASCEAGRSRYEKGPLRDRLRSSPMGEKISVGLLGQTPPERFEEYRYVSAVVEVVAREVGKKREEFSLHTSRVVCINHDDCAAIPSIDSAKFTSETALSQRVRGPRRPRKLHLRTSLTDFTRCAVPPSGSLHLVRPDLESEALDVAQVQRPRGCRPRRAVGRAAP